MAWHRPHPSDIGGGILTPAPAAVPGPSATRRQAPSLHWLPPEVSRGQGGWYYGTLRFLISTNRHLILCNQISLASELTLVLTKLVILFDKVETKRSQH